jgi:hypothetical protein
MLTTNREQYANNIPMCVIEFSSLKQRSNQLSTINVYWNKQEIERLKKLLTSGCTMEQAYQYKKRLHELMEEEKKKL